MPAADLSTRDSRADGCWRPAPDSPAPDLTVLLFSGDFDRVTAALTVATGAAASGHRVHLYFAFWGLLALRVDRRLRGKSFVHRVLALVLPAGVATLSTSRLNMGGIGPRLFGRLMRQQGMPLPGELLQMARDLDVQLFVCPNSMDIMGLAADELMPGIGYAGVASFTGDVTRSKSSLVF